ncbi:hypothetical protein [Aureimonas psammosilenae]|uniref:hypothetical protein n=1 Tax=Aureimonas psammosilenae TaxID=2495496 RepID=UPI00126054BA|nr:hypothetical protein [Aureimonas psammosilenae]
MLNIIIMIVVGVLCFREGYKAGKKRYIKKFEKIIKKKLEKEYVITRRDSEVDGEDIIYDLFK